MISGVPFLPIPFKAIRRMAHGFYPITAFLLRFYPSLEIDLAENDSKLSAKDYFSGALIAGLLYFVGCLALLAPIAARNGLLGDQGARMIMLGFSAAIALAVFGYILAYPKWMSSRRQGELERNLLFAARHLMIQTSAGVPFFDSIVSISEEYEDSRLNYGQIGREFGRIVKEVRGGRELTAVLEDAAAASPSPYFKRMLWQLANANKAGANMGFVLRDIVEFLSNEQRILIRDYGSQLNPLAMFYMLICIIAPTMGVIFLAIFASIAAVPVNELTFLAILVLLAAAQIVFIGLIKSRRPMVAM